MPITYDNTNHTYYDSSGNAISSAGMQTYIQQGQAISSATMGDIAASYANGNITSSQFRSQMRQVIKQSSMRQYAMGRGGFNFMTPRDYGIVGRWLRDQYRYLDGFVSDLPDLSEAQIRARAQLYSESTEAMYWRGSSHYLPNLPNYPRDGQTICGPHCKCYLDIDRINDTTFHVYWRLGQAEHCQNCLQLNGEWNPLIIENGVIRNKKKEAKRANSNDTAKAACGCSSSACEH